MIKLELEDFIYEIKEEMECYAEIGKRVLTSGKKSSENGLITLRLSILMLLKKAIK